MGTGTELHRTWYMYGSDENGYVPAGLEDLLL